MRLALKGSWLNDFDPIRIRVLDERQALHAAVVDRSHALRGNAARDAPRPKSVTPSVTGGVPTQSVGTIWRLVLKGRWLNDFDPIRIRGLDERQALHAAVIQALVRPPVTLRVPKA